jgi:hypothetical protein
MLNESERYRVTTHGLLVFLEFEEELCVMATGLLCDVISIASRIITYRRTLTAIDSQSSK